MQIASNADNMPLDADGKRDWSNSLFGCFSDCGTCCIATFCPCIVYSQITSRLDHLATRGSPHPSGGEVFTSECLGYAVTRILGVSCLLQMGQRSSTRGRYNIAGDGFTDFLATWCCAPCDLVQESREIELEENSYGKQSY
ncbi:PLAC8-domain-containing protein [Thelephora terrestris]|uniref:PLAC8-domain-containing protein n=1 Tax=Thelephora terrestris TaxID=56493 RepID=A0A9P6HDF6_9AGAM|nr:PLAC8-domain-containing protein [Thelephora terrestris]